MFTCKGLLIRSGACYSSLQDLNPDQERKTLTVLCALMSGRHIVTAPSAEWRGCNAHLSHCHSAKENASPGPHSQRAWAVQHSLTSDLNVISKPQPLNTPLMWAQLFYFFFKNLFFLMCMDVLPECMSIYHMWAWCLHVDTEDRISGD